MTIAIIGLDDDIVKEIKELSNERVVSYPMPPKGYSLEGQMYVEHPHRMDDWIAPSKVIFYSYFDDAQEFRRALALSNTPTFPDVRATDDKVNSLIMASKFLADSLPRGYLTLETVVDLPRESVVKIGNSHCGENKIKTHGKYFGISSGLVEPFIVGDSYRVLSVGDKYTGCHRLVYLDSNDWRKNVNGTSMVITELAESENILLHEGINLAQNLSLEVCGSDFIIDKDGNSYLLEVNAYPGLDDVPEAKQTFIDLAASFCNK